MILTENKLRYHWSKEVPLLLNGKQYRVGRMSFGDYFLEPGPIRGERESFNKGTLWLTKIYRDTYKTNE